MAPAFLSIRLCSNMNLTGSGSGCVQNQIWTWQWLGRGSWAPGWQLLQLSQPRPGLCFKCLFNFSRVCVFKCLFNFSPVCVFKCLFNFSPVCVFKMTFWLFSSVSFQMSFRLFDLDCCQNCFLISALPLYMPLSISHACILYTACLHLFACLFICVFMLVDFSLFSMHAFSFS